MPSRRVFDVAVVGAGVAGLQAALTLGRACRSVLLVDDALPRNRAAARVTNYLGAPALAPRQLLDVGARMVEAYDVTRVAGTVTAAEVAVDGGFAITAGGVAHRSRAVVLADGVEDVLPPVDGVAELWGRQVVACPHCHGWEVRGRPLAQIGFADDPDQAAGRAVLLSRWSEQVVFFPGRSHLCPALADRLDRAGVAVRLGPLEALAATEAGVTVHTAGREETFVQVFSAVRQRARSDLAVRLGCRANGSAPGTVLTDPSGRTSVDGVWVAGSAAHPTSLAIGAAGHASLVATQVHAWLIDDELAGR